MNANLCLILIYLEVRINMQELERLIWQTIDVMDNFENFREEIKNGEMPFDVATAERATAAHVSLKKKIFGAPIERIQQDVERVITSKLLQTVFCQTLQL